MSATLSGRSVVVTNAATDLGRQVCARLVRAGARVTAQPAGHRVGPAQLVADAVAAFGCLDGFVNCYALLPDLGGPVESLTLEAFIAGISTNLSEPFFGCQAAAAQMLDQVCPHGTPANRGNIVNITSVAGMLALPGHATFCSAMAGLNVATKIFAAEWGPRAIRVTAVGAGLSPGVLAGVLPAGRSARRVPERSVVTPEQVAEAVCFLLGDAAAGVAGSTLYVDGGWLADGYWE
ncbi:MAG: SDR family oxidoreductase [Chloroflexi bacterium]|nr:SDR family oxidoreductase [Chloroflexota bacterium]